MLDRLARDRLLMLTRYERILTVLFRSLTVRYSSRTLPDELPFDLDDLRRAMQDAVADNLIPRIIKNPADIKYTFDARRELPIEVEQCGPITWLQTAKGCYKFKRTRRKNIIDLDSFMVGQPPLEHVADQTPPFIASLLGSDEQATFTRVRNAGLISSVLGFQSWPIQGHHRTTVSYGQIEIDEVQAGLDGQKGTIVPISGKGGQDKLSWSQALNLNTYGKEKAPLPDLAVRSIGLWRDDMETVWIVEFSPHLDIDEIEVTKIRRFKFR
jgi:hypothetical protein